MSSAWSFISKEDKYIYTYIYKELIEQNLYSSWGFMAKIRKKYMYKDGLIKGKKIKRQGLCFKQQCLSNWNQRVLKIKES